MGHCGAHNFNLNSHKPKVRKFDASPSFVKVGQRIESRTLSLAFSPHLPSGSLLYSALVLAHRLSCNTNRLPTMERIYGSRTMSITNLFGAGAEHIAHSYFADSLSADQVLRQHTLFGFYSLGLSDSVLTGWSRQLRNGSAIGTMGFTKTRGPVAAVNGLRWCSECACSDQSELGFAAWRVVHQLPFVSTCPVHGSPLYIYCQDCQSPLDTGKQYRLPGESCCLCGSSRFTALTQIENPAYSSLISRCEEAFRTQSDEFKPQVWARRVNKFVAAHDSHDAATAVLSDRICKKWGVQSPEDINNLLSLCLGQDYVAGLLRCNTGKYPLVTKLITGDAMPMDPLGETTLRAFNAVPVYVPTTVGGRTDAQALRSRLEELFVEYGVSPQVLDKLLSGFPIYVAAIACGVAESQLFQLVNHPECRPIITAVRAAAVNVRKNRVRKNKLVVSNEERRYTYRRQFYTWMDELTVLTRIDTEQTYPAILRWLQENDREWLGEMFPVRMLYRQRCLGLAREPNLQVHPDSMLGDSRHLELI